MITLVFSSAAMFIKWSIAGDHWMLKETVLVHWILFYRLKVAFYIRPLLQWISQFWQTPSFSISWWSLSVSFVKLTSFVLSLKIHWNTVIRLLFLVCFPGFYGRSIALVSQLLSLQFTLCISVWIFDNLGGKCHPLVWYGYVQLVSCVMGFILFL